MVYNMTEEEWDAVIEVHLKGTFAVVRHACGYFRKQRSGCIITFSSLSGLVGNAGAGQLRGREGRHRRLYPHGRHGHGPFRRHCQ